MAEIINIKNEAGEVQYPVTKPECVIDENGKNVLQLIRENGSSSSYDDTELRERIEENEILIEDLQNTKIDKEADDYYPQLAVGLADNLAGVDVVDSEVNFRRSGGGAISDGVARIEAIKGNSVVWNQLRDVADKAHLFLKANISIEITEGSNKIKLSGIYDGTGGDLNAYIDTLFPSIIGVIGHKYLCTIKGNINTQMTVYGAVKPSVIGMDSSIIVTCSTDGSVKIVPRIMPSLAEGTEINEEISFYCTDLTKMFGAGDEPTTIEEFYARIPMGVDLNAYNEGEVIHMDVQSIESVGVNQWDEQCEIGNISGANGGNVSSDTLLRSKNYIPIIPSIKYYSTIHFGKGVFFYDDKKEFITRLYNLNSIPQNARYMRFVAPADYGTTYNHDICINISDTSINGKYFPYIKRTEDLSIIRKYFPDGMKSAGTAHDEIRYNKATQKWEMVQRIGSVDMGTLTWYYMPVSDTRPYGRLSASLKDRKMAIENLVCSLYVCYGYRADIDKNIFGATNEPTIIVIDSAYTDTASFKAAMQGAMLYYELAEPIVTELDTEDQFRDLDYQVWNCGTEKAIAEGKSAPLAADITYGFNAIGKIKELESLVAQLRAKVGI